MAGLTTKVHGTFGKRGGAKTWARFSVDVDVTSVEDLIDSVLESVSPPGLYVFMEGQVAEYFQEQVVNIFSSLGGGVPGGSWAPLTETTIKIREMLGYMDDMAINERTGRLFDWALTHSTDMDAFGVMLEVPDMKSAYAGESDMMRKLTTAQQGWTQGAGDMIPDAHTPPRPILGLDSGDEVAMHAMLQIHIAEWVASGGHGGAGFAPGNF